MANYTHKQNKVHYTLSTSLADFKLLIH